MSLHGKLHPAALLLAPLAQVLPAGALVIAGRTGLAVVLMVGAAATSVLRWLRLRWRVERGTFVVEQGLLTRQRRVIPLERIQRVDLSRSLRHRLLGVVELRVEAVGGSDTEGKLEALTVTDANELRHVLLRRSAAVEDHESDEVLASVSRRDLMIAGLTGGRVGVVAALLGAADQVFGGVVFTALERLPLLEATTAVVLAVTAVAGVFVIAVAATVVTNWDFRLTAEGEDLRVRRGLLQQRLDTVPLRRVQAVRIEENLVRRALGLARVTVEVAGQAGEKASRETGVLLPIGSRVVASRLVARVLDRPECAAVELTPMPQAARTRRLWRAALATAVLTAAATVAAGPVGVAALPLVGLAAVLLALAAYRALGHARADDLLVTRSGVFVRETAFVPRDRLQVLTLRTSPTQRRAGLATLVLHVARSPGGHDPTLIDLDVDDATRLQADLSHPPSQSMHDDPPHEPTEAG